MSTQQIESTSVSRRQHPTPGTTRTADPTLADSLREHAYGLNLVRLALALLVLASHTLLLGGYGPEPSWPTLGSPPTLGKFAVGTFFVLSGLLVTMSARRSTAGGFLFARALRIFPAFLVVVLIGAFVIGPAVTLADHGTLSGYFTLTIDGPFGYVLRNLTFPIGLQAGIHDVFATTTPYGNEIGHSVVNGSLWTLPYEIRAYLVAGIVVLIGKRFAMAPTAAVAVLVSGLLVWLQQVEPELAEHITAESFPAAMSQLLFVFSVGVLLGTVAEKVRLSTATVAGALAVFAAASVAGGIWFVTAGIASLVILVPALARALPVRRFAFLRNDLSYGVYIWAYPTQQLASYAGLNANVVVYVLVCVTATMALAAASWFLVEQPAMRLKKRGR